MLQKPKKNDGDPKLKLFIFFGALLSSIWLTGLLRTLPDIPAGYRTYRPVTGHTGRLSDIPAGLSDIPTGLSEISGLSDIPAGLSEILSRLIGLWAPPAARACYGGTSGSAYRTLKYAVLCVYAQHRLFY